MQQTSFIADASGIDASTIRPAAIVDGQPIDEQGNPFVQITGCPNCAERTGPEWMHPLQYTAEINAGREPNGYCSRACRLQHDYQRELEQRDTDQGRVDG
jgi:hypothetical protein